MSSPQLPPGAEVEIVGQPVSPADKNYHSWQKLFDKNLVPFPGIEILWQSLRTFVSRMFPVCLNSVQGVFPKDFKGVLNLIFLKRVSK